MFVTFEGLDGSGKTTQLRLLEARLRARGVAVTALRQPGGTVLGDRLREVLLDGRAALGPIAPLAELAMMFADRAQAIAEVIEPALKRGEVVLCDRFTDSSEAYQGGGRGLSSERVLAVHRAVCGTLMPDLTFLLLPPLEVSLKRARRRNAEHLRVSGVDENRFEQEGEAFYRRIHTAYLAIAVREPERVVLVEEDAGAEAIAAHVLEVMESRLAGVPA